MSFSKRLDRGRVGKNLRKDLNSTMSAKPLPMRFVLKKIEKHRLTLAFSIATDKIGANWCDCCRNGKVLTDVVGRLSEMPVDASRRQVDEEADVVKHLGMVDHVGLFVFQLGARAQNTLKMVPGH